MFDFRRDPSPTGSSNADHIENDGNTSNTTIGGRLPSLGPSQPAPPILTRPRAGAATGQGAPPARRDPVEDATNATDSITLGQLKAHTAAMQVKEKAQQFDYRYEDTDTLMSELEEFYPYVEMPRIAEGPSRFHNVFKGDWTEASSSKRRDFIEIQLEYLESSVQDTRRSAQSTLLYLIQGCFGETTSPEMQLHWVIENCKTVRSLDGVASLVVALKDSTRRYNTAMDVSGENPPSTSSFGPKSGTIPPDPYDDRSGELMDVLAMLYFLVEVFRSDETFGDELMAMSPPLPLVLFSMVAGLKDRLPKGYPVKKVLLLLWKTLLACLGGMKEVTKAKELARDLAGLAPVDKDFTKATPIDISNWRRDTSVKYPTFAPPPSSSVSVPNEKLAEGMKPIPARPNYHSTEIQSPPWPAPINTVQPVPTTQQGSAPLPGTPAPTPPGSPAPKPKKQQYQTDPNRPFIFPYSRITGETPSSLVPFAIDEADKLYHRHAYISLGLYQLWEARDDCMREERGLGRSGLIGFAPSRFDEEEDEDDIEAMRREWRYEEEEMKCLARGDKEGAKLAKERKAAARRLHRVDIIYKNTLPIMQSCVIVLLKLLLATVTGPGAANVNNQNALPPGFTSPTQDALPAAENTPPPTREELDIARHREITSKAVSAILILLLKWYKVSHILKFHYFAQLLFDSNCLLLVLKMFGLSDVFVSVRAKNEWQDWNFFRYCQLNCSKSPLRPEDEPPRPVKATPKMIHDGEDEIELISEYSWRNFFSSINFLKILQKMTKHRGHRTYMLQQYKSSQILKRMLKVSHPMLQLQVLKLIKSQMPWCGRKWRQSNMKVITSIYLNCRPELRDEWLAGQDQETELEDALPQEYALRSLIQFYNKRHYSAHLAPINSPEPGHERSNSTSAVMIEDPALHPPPHAHSHSQSGSTSSGGGGGEHDVFPPRRTDVAMPYNPDGMIEFWLHEYEDVLLEVFGDGHSEDEWDSLGGPGMSGEGLEDGLRGLSGVGGWKGRSVPGVKKDDVAWTRLGEIMRAKGEGMGDDDGISDSESVVTVGELSEEARLDQGGEMRDGGGGLGSAIVGFGGEMGEVRSERRGEGKASPAKGDEGVFSRQQRERQVGENTWEHMSPQTLSLLPRSPAERRRSSSSSGGSPLRPVMPSSLVGLGVASDPFAEDEDEEVDLRGPMPIERETADERERAFGAVDEVEYAYGE